MPVVDANEPLPALVNAMALIDAQNNTIAMLTGRLETVASTFDEFVTSAYLEDAMRSLATVTAQHLSKLEERTAALQRNSSEFVSSFMNLQDDAKELHARLTKCEQKHAEAHKHVQEQMKKLHPYVKSSQRYVKELRDRFNKDDQTQAAANRHTPEHFNMRPVAGLAGAVSLRGVGNWFSFCGDG